MITVFYGNDTVKVRAAAYRHTEKIAKAEQAVVTVTPETYTVGMFADLAGSSSLFGTSDVVVFDTLSLKQECYEDLKENLTLLAESTNQFVIIEEALLAAEKGIHQTY